MVSIADLMVSMRGLMEKDMMWGSRKVTLVSMMVMLENTEVTLENTEVTFCCIMD